VTWYIIKDVGSPKPYVDASGHWHRQQLKATRFSTVDGARRYLNGLIRGGARLDGDDGEGRIVRLKPRSTITTSDRVTALLSELTAEEQGAVLRFVKHVLADRGGE